MSRARPSAPVAAPFTWQHAHPFEGDRHHSHFIQNVNESGRLRARFGRQAQTVLAPSGFNPEAVPADEPTADLVVDWVHGYNGEAVGSLAWLHDQECIFPVGAIVVLQRLEPSEQRHFLGHTAAVMCVAYCKATNLCASGQKTARGGGPPFVCTWSPRDCGLRSVLLFHTTRVSGVGFSPSGDRLFTYGGSEQEGFLVAVWKDFECGLEPRADIRGELPIVCRQPVAVEGAGKVPGSAMAIADRYGLSAISVQFVIYDGGLERQEGSASGVVLEFFDCVSTEAGFDLSKKHGVFSGPSSERPRKILCCTWAPCGVKCLVCGDNGSLYFFEGAQAYARLQVCSGPLGFAVLAPDGEMFLGGFTNHMLYFGNVAVVRTNAMEQAHAELSPTSGRSGASPPSAGRSMRSRTLQRRLTRDAEDAGRSSNSRLEEVHFNATGGALLCATATLKPQTVSLLVRTDGSKVALLGTQDLHLLLFDVTRRQLSRVVTLAHRGEMGALCHYPNPEMPLFATGSTFGTVRFWDLARCSPVVGRVLKYSQEQGVRALDFSAAGDLLGIGHNDGTLRVLTFPELQPAFERKVTKGKAAVACVRFSVTGDQLAVGCHDTLVYMYRISPEAGDAGGGRPTVELMMTIKGLSSAVTHVQFCGQSEFLLAAAADGGLLVAGAQTGEKHGQGLLRDMMWDGAWTMPCGWQVVGIWAVLKQGMSELNSVCSLEKWSDTRNMRSPILASASFDGLVRLYNFPAVHEFQGVKAFYGHGSSVTCVRFAPEGSVSRGSRGGAGHPYPAYLVSTGGEDRAIIQWGVRPPEIGKFVKHPRRHCPWLGGTRQGAASQTVDVGHKTHPGEEQCRGSKIWGWNDDSPTRDSTRPSQWTPRSHLGRSGSNGPSTGPRNLRRASSANMVRRRSG